MDLDLICPDHTTLSRRSQTLKELQEQLKKVQKKESIHILIDSTGLKIYGAGEWEEAKHGKGRRKGWMKLHLAIDENSKEIEENMTQRDLNILRIHMDRRDVWEYASGYSKRNLVENAMFRFKNNIGPKLRARTSKREEAEIELGVHLLNQMRRLGMSDSVRIR